jgi:bacterioferritin
MPLLGDCGRTTRPNFDRLSDILDNEEDAVDFIETQLELIQLTGLENYIQLQSDSAAHSIS